MFDKRIKKMEKELRRIEYETKDSIWKLNNPPEFLLFSLEQDTSTNHKVLNGQTDRVVEKIENI